MSLRSPRSVALAAAVLCLVAACKSSNSANAGHSGLSPIIVTPTGTPDPSPSVRATITRAPVTLAPVTPAPSVTPHPSRSARPRLGDLTIRLGRRACGFYSDTSGGLWLNPSLIVGWTGPGPFPAANLGFSMTTNYGKATAGGPVTSTAPFTWAIGGESSVGNAWLGQTVKITITIDPGNDVLESNESNNTDTITVSVPSPLPFAPNGSDGDNTIPCS